MRLESHFYSDAYGDRNSPVLCGGLKSVLSNRISGLFIQSEACGLLQTKVLRFPLCVHNNSNPALDLVGVFEEIVLVRLSRFLGELGNRILRYPWWRDAAADTIDSFIRAIIKLRRASLKRGSYPMYSPD